MKLEEVMTVDVTIISDGIQQLNGKETSVVMIPFSGSVSGKYFTGTILPGGIDTQVIGPEGKYHTLSARYMVKGKNHLGEPCTIYIENNGVINDERENQIFIARPTFITDNKALEFLTTESFVAEALQGQLGPKIVIYRIAA